MDKRFAWSFSRLTNFETCPKKYYHSTILKDFPDVESEQMRYGKAVHKGLELRIGKGIPLPLGLTYLEPVAAKFAGATGEKMVEQQLTLNDKFEPTGWFDSDAWCRAIVDLAIVNGEAAVLVDWKTGSMKDDFTQMQLCGAIFFIHKPEVQVANLLYYWTKDKKPTHKMMHRDDATGVWASLLPRVKRLEKAHAEYSFPPRPSGLCRKHCAVSSCPHHGG